MQGDFDRARELIAAAAALTEELGLEIAGAGVQSDAAEIELLAGRPDAAERAIRPAVETLERVGNHGHYVTVAPVLAEALLLLERYDEVAAIIDHLAGCPQDSLTELERAAALYEKEGNLVSVSSIRARQGKLQTAQTTS